MRDFVATLYLQFYSLSFKNDMYLKQWLAQCVSLVKLMFFYDYIFVDVLLRLIVQVPLRPREHTRRVLLAITHREEEVTFKMQVNTEADPCKQFLCTFNLL